MDIFFSFIIPNLNSSGLLEQTINSIIASKYEYKYEVIVVDGLSLDGSIKFLQESKYKNIILISGKDVNVYDAMNKGIRLSRGEWLMFLGAGDTISDSFFKINLKSYKKFKLVYGNVFWQSKGLIYDGSFTLKKIFYKNICQQAIIYNRKCFINSKYFNIHFPINADYEFNLENFISFFNEVKYVNEVICNYHGNGISHFKTDLFHKQKNIIILKKLFASKSFTNKILFFEHIVLLFCNKIKSFIKV